jgi:uncharacterized protein
MPATLSYPGVYIEEIPSGVRTITGVATSITAFLGRAVFGPVNSPVTLNSFGDFERAFGGLAVDYPLGYAVRDFFLNGGGQAVVVRLYKNPDTVADATSTIAVDGLDIKAKYPGAWGQKLRLAIDVEVSNEMRTKLNLAAADALFNLTVRYGNRSEKFLNLTNNAQSARRVDRVLADSNLVAYTWPNAAPALPLTVAAATAYTELLAAPADAAKQTAYKDAAKKLVDGASTAEAALAATLAVTPPVPADVTAARTALAAAEAALKGDNGKALAQAADFEGSQNDKTGLYALDKVDLFNLLVIPPDSRGGDVPNTFYQTAIAYAKARRAFVLVDSPVAWSANPDTAAAAALAGFDALGLSGESARNAALYFPLLKEADPLRDGQLDYFVPSGAVAGIFARTDASRGVWKAPAGLDASINGIQGLNVVLNDAENGMLNPAGINVLRAFPGSGRVVWGARTLRGADKLADEWKYIPVRRTALFIEESLYRGTQWVVFEPNDEPLWAQIRLNIGAFMHNLFRLGAFQGSTPKDAYFVKCDKETTTQNDINLGVVNIVVGFAPLKPAEFVVIKLQQIAGQIEV